MCRPVLEGTADSTRGVGARNGDNDAEEICNHHPRWRPTAQQGVPRSVSPSPDLLSYTSHLVGFLLIFPRRFVRPRPWRPLCVVGLSELRLLTASKRSRKATVFQHMDEELFRCAAALLSNLLC